MSQVNSKLWTKDFIILSLVNFFLILIHMLLNVIIALYAVNEFNASTGQAGVVAGIFIIGALIGRLVTGKIINRVEYKRILIIGLIFFTITILLYFIDYSLPLLMVGRLLNGLAMGIATTVIGTIVVLAIPKSRRGEGISYFAVSTALATGIGPFLGIYMTQHTEFNIIFLFSLSLGAVSTIVGFFVNVPMAPKTTEENRGGFKISNYIEPKAVPIGIIVLLMTFSFSSVLSYINLYAVELDLVSAASFFFGIYTVSVLVSRPFTGKLVDRKGANYIMYPAFFLFGAGMLLLSTVDQSLTLLLAGGLIGLGFGNISSISQTVITLKVTPERIGYATATFFIFYDIGTGFGPFILGLIIPFTGYSMMYAILGIMVFAVSFSIIFYMGRRKEKIECSP